MYRSRKPNGAILRRDHGMNAKSIRHPQACTQVMRVLYSIQYQKQRRLGKGIQYVLDIDIAAGGI